jgi:hypothetical protein
LKNAQVILKSTHENLTFSQQKNEDINNRLNNRNSPLTSKDHSNLSDSGGKQPKKRDPTFEHELNYRQMAAIVKENKEKLSRATRHDIHDMELIISFWDYHSDQALTATDPQTGYCISRNFLKNIERQTLELFQSIDFD